MSDPKQRTAETLRAWDLAAGKYAATIDADVAALRAGVLDLSLPEREALLPLVSPTTRLLHVRCSHGQSALGLWRATGCEVVGVDGSAAMLAVAREKARRLEAASGRERFAPDGPAAPQAWEQQWTLGQIVTAVADAGLRIERLVEYAAHFWPEFPHVPDAELARLPHSFLLVARADASRVGVVKTPHHRH